MPRPHRFAPPGLFLHLTQRGNYRQRTFFTDTDREQYLALLDRHSGERGITLAGYCVMSNHVHLLVRAEQEGAISTFMQCVSGEYARWLHGRMDRVGRLWQGRFYSCALEEASLTAVLRYIERNPVRAQMVDHAAGYPWSSAAAHLRQAAWPDWLDQNAFHSRWTVSQWQQLLAESQSRTELSAIRSATRRSLPMGSESFLQSLEMEWSLTLRPKASGRPRKGPVREEPSKAVQLAGA